MLHEEHGHPGRCDLSQHVGEGGRLGFVLTAGRLVEEQHLRFGGQRAGQLHPSGLSRGEPVGPHIGQLGDAEPVEQAVRRPVGIGSPGDVGGQAHVLSDGEQTERLQALEGASQPLSRPLERCQARDVRAAEQDATSCRLLEAADHVEQRGLAGAVRADQPGDGPGLRPERHAVERSAPTELDGDLSHLERGHVATPTDVSIPSDASTARSSSSDSGVVEAGPLRTTSSPSAERSRHHDRGHPWPHQQARDDHRGEVPAGDHPAEGEDRAGREGPGQPDQRDRCLRSGRGSRRRCRGRRRWGCGPRATPIVPGRSTVEVLHERQRSRWRSGTRRA